ncbi:Uncharacterised protein [Mycoplasmopsis maculosa]|uniref:SGNH hydrolase-type esterase domain-containing protein n=1 Tax=Mycoplasmopsis maculosa TaxID=114885 RepID=A0A449B590_9BACT|nr:SGNH/GDSL hydrolase family protein [Mycoplasmopsis maculosa]VEU75736.1 Uncharacterised protein [Mycoplasmopsis maculosa]
MKIKLKPLLIGSGITLAATISLAIGLSYIPIGDKKLEKSSPDLKINDTNKELVIPEIPKQIEKIEITDKSNEIIKLDDRNKSIDFITQDKKIRYVALGDSISAGFDANLDKDYPGELNEKTKELSGISFPSYLASFFQKIEENKLQSFKNFARTSSTIQDWFLMLDYPNVKDSLNKDQLDLLNFYFGNDIEAFRNELLKRLEDANLITITLGANDFIEVLTNSFSKIPFIDLITEIQNNDLKISKLISLFSSTLDEVFSTINNRQSLFIEKLKKFTNTTNINFISYPMPLAHISKVLDSLIPTQLNSDSETISIGKILLDLLNNEIKSVANANGINFIDSYDNVFWNKNLIKLVPNLIEIHPSSFGYKKMAQDVFAKLIISSRNIEEINSNNINWSSNFLKSDSLSFLNQIELFNHYEKINLIFENDMDKYTFFEDEIFLKYKNLKSKDNFFNRVLNREFVYEGMLNALYNSFFESSILKNEEGLALKEFFDRNNGENWDLIKQWFIKSKYIPRALEKTQFIYLNTDWDNNGEPGSESVNYKNLLFSLKEAFTNEGLVVNLIKTFFQIDFLKENKEEFRTLISNVFQNIIKTDLSKNVLEKISNVANFESISEYISNEDFLLLSQKIINNENIKTLISDLILNLIDDSNKYSDANNYNDLWKVFISNDNNKLAIKKGLNSITNSILKDNEARQIISKTLSKTVFKNNILSANLEEQKLVDTIDSLLSSFEKTNNKLNLIEKVTGSLLNNLSNDILNFDLKKSLKQSFGELINLFNNENTQELIIDFIKILSESKLNENESTISNLLKNSLNYFSLKYDLPRLIVDLLYTDKNNEKISEIIEKENLVKVISKILNGVEIDDFIDSLVNFAINIEEQELNSIENIKDLIKLFFDKAISTNIYDSFTSIIKKTLSYEEIKQAIKKVLLKINKRLSNIIEDERVDNFIETIFNNPNFKFLLNDFIKKGLLNKDVDLFNEIDFNDILKNWLENDNYKNVSNELTSLLKSLIGDNFFNENIIDILYDYLFLNSDLSNNLNENDFKIVLKDNINLILKFDEKTNILRNISETFLKYLSLNGTKIDNEELILEIKSSSIEKIKKLDIKYLILETAKNLFSNEKYLSNKNILKQLIINLFNKYKNNDSLIEKISNLINEKISQHLGTEINFESLKNIVKSIFNSDEFLDIFDSFIFNFFELSANEVVSSNSIEELLEKIISRILTNDNLEKINSLLINIINLDDFSIIVREIKDNLSNENIFKTLNSNDYILFFNELFSNPDFNFLIKETISKIIFPNILKENFNIKNSFIHYINNFDNLNLLKNKMFNLLKFLINNNSFKKVLIKQIEKEISKYPELTKNINENSRKELFLDIFENFDKISEAFNFEQIFNSVFDKLKENDFDFSNIMSIFVNSFKENLLSANFEDSILKTFKEIWSTNILKNNKLTLNKFLDNFYDYLKHNENLKGELVNYLYENLKDNLTFLEQEKSKKVLNEVFENSNFKLLFTKLFTSIFDTEYDEVKKISNLKQLINFLAKKMLDKNSLNELIKLFKFIIHNENVKNIIIENINNYININENEFIDVSTILIENETTSEIIENILKKAVFDDSVLWSDLESFDTFIKKWLSTNENKSFVALKIGLLIKEVLSTSKIKEFLIDKLTQLTINNNDVSINISRDEIHSLYTDIYDSISGVYNLLDIDDFIFNEVIEELSNNGKNFDLNIFLNSLINKFKEKLENKNLDSFALNIIKELDKNTLLTNHKNTLNKLLNNIVRTYSKNDNFLNYLSNLIIEKAPEIKEFISIENFNNLFKNSIKTTEFENFIFSISNSLVNLTHEDLSTSSTFKTLINKAINNIINSNAFDNVYDFIQKVASYEETKLLIIKLLEKIPGVQPPIFSTDQIGNVINSLTNSEPLKNVLKLFIKNGLFDYKITSFDQIKDYDLIIKTLLSDEQRKNQIKENIKEIVELLIRDNDVRFVISSYIYKGMSNSNVLIKNIEESNMISFISKSLLAFPKINEFLGLTDLLISTFVDDLAEFGLNIDFNNLTSKIGQKLLEKFENSDWEEQFTKLIKLIVSRDVIDGNKELLIQFISNVFEYLGTKAELGKKIFNKLPEKIKNILKSIDENDFNHIFRSILENQEGIQSVIRNVVSNVVDNINEYEQANNLVEILRIYTKNPERVKELTNSFSSIINTILSNSSVHKLLKGLWKEHLSEYYIDVNDNRNIAFVDDLLKSLPQLVTDLKLVNNFAETISTTVNEYDSLTNILANIGSILVKGLKVTEFNFIKTVLTSNPARKHKEILKIDILKIVEGFTSDDRLVNKFIDDFNLANVLTKFGLTEQSSRNAFIALLKSQHVQKILNAFLNEVFDNVDKYAQFNEWIYAIEAFFRSSNATIVKEALKDWIKQLLSENNEISYTIGKILADSMRKNEWTNVETDDIIGQKFMYSLLNSVAQTNILNNVVNNIFDTFKNLSRYKNEGLGNALISAIKKGALSFISSENGNIQLSKIFENIPLLENILSRVDVDDYRDFINWIFASSPLNINKGIFAIPFGEGNQNNSNFEVGFNGFVDVIKGKLRHLIRAFVTPLLKSYVKELLETNTVYSNINEVKRNSKGYQAVWRTFAFLAATLSKNAGSWTFWNFVEPHLRGGFREAFETAISPHKLELSRKYTSNITNIGLSLTIEPIENYWSGTPSRRFRTEPNSNSTNNYRYLRDYVLIYVYYINEYDRKYNPNKRYKDVLMEDMHNGFMPASED